MGGARESKITSLWNLMRKKRWLWPFAALLALWVFCEIYDYVPHNSWIHRQLDTMFMVDVTVKLTVDGQPVTLTRTIRCVDQPYRSSFAVAVGGASRANMSVVSTLSASFGDNRRFLVNVEDACSKLAYLDNNNQYAFKKISSGWTSSERQFDYEYDKRMRHPHWYDFLYFHRLAAVKMYQMEPTSLKAGQLEPIDVTEYVGKGWPDHINLYFDHPALLRGANGVRLDDIIITQSAKRFQLFDAEDHDRFDEFRLWGCRMYSGVSMIVIPPEIWQSYEPALLLRRNSELDKELHDHVSNSYSVPDILWGLQEYHRKNSDKSYYVPAHRTDNKWILREDAHGFVTLEPGRLAFSFIKGDDWVRTIVTSAGPYDFLDDDSYIFSRGGNLYTLNGNHESCYTR